ncbi:hypothetical protein NDU88_001488 [Pleurodeles waltl]|uniref:Uncharacterized protein n=1 Tax=Pleurodeles waltl TaxID=8319 RepID=A0AAV7RB06_PLEWA|nr:hypothetical protein NDU88_001488 [Pleurodeles waltl]
MCRCQGAGRDGGRAPPLRASARDASLRVGVIPHSRPWFRGLPKGLKPAPLVPLGVSGEGAPPVTDVGRSSSPAPMSAPAALGGPSERPLHRRHRRVARRRAELGSQAAIMDRGQTTPRLWCSCNGPTASIQIWQSGL